MIANFMQNQMSTHSRRAAGLPALVLMLLLAIASAGCGSSASSTGTGSTSTGGTTADSGAVAPQQYGGSYSNETATGDTQAGADFARWVLDQDPNRQYITDAVVRNEASLGVKVQPTITKGDLQ